MQDLKEFGFGEIDHTKFSKYKKPYKIYAELIDETTAKQFEDVLRQDFVTQASLMPDAHSGYSMPIGGVCATKGVVVPQFVGFDIGCGMCAYQTDFSKNDILPHSKEIYDLVVDTIPLGFSTHKNHQPFKYDLPLTSFAQSVLNSIGLRQLGTLGGGNHFIEIGFDESERVWIIIHSGSRGFGHKIASYYMVEAYLSKKGKNELLEERIKDFESRNRGFREHNPSKYKKALAKFIDKQKIEIAKKSKPDNITGIHPLSVDSPLGQDYIKDQKFALFFALENRKRMIENVHKIINQTLKANYQIDFDDEDRFINRNHNHTEFEESRGEWIHRKGATHAKKGMMGVIPGNMRDGSFIVKGKGNFDSLESSSHGAGRVMSRNQAKKVLKIDDFIESMSGITGTVDINTIDESPFAYKNIFEVMELQKDLVDVIAHIKPLINIKDNSPKKF